MRRIATVLVCLSGTLGFAASAQAVTYYVSPRGNDAAAGTSQAAPWKTVARASSARLAPGDSVLFEGGATFSDTDLEPRGSGSLVAPTRYASYGTGKAVLAKGVWMHSQSFVTLENLKISGDGVSSSASGTGVVGAKIANSEIADVRYGVINGSTTDRGWTISGNLIQRTRDSGIIVFGADFTISGNRIYDTGVDASIAYGKHGVYAKGPGARVVGNDIQRPAQGGISTRYPNAVIEGNRILGGTDAIAYFQDSNVGGTTRIAYNRIVGAKESGIYLNGSTVEKFVIVNNSIAPASGAAMDLKPVPAVVVANNLVAGGYRWAFSVWKQPSFSAHHNLWQPNAVGKPFLWAGTPLSFADYKRVSQQGSGDMVADAKLSADLAPAAGSPAIDHGSTVVAGASYSLACDGLPLHYCGAAPDLGAVEKSTAGVLGATHEETRYGLSLDGLVRHVSPAARSARAFAARHR